MLKIFFQKKPKIIIVLGQTSTGKSDLAVEIAKKINGEIISADSRQVYRGMDLGSGKITREEMQGIHHYLLDIADPKEIFDVQQFQTLGTKTIKEILKNEKTPIICGGTGFYIDSLIYKIQFSPIKPNQKLRKFLEKKTLEELQSLYRKKTSTISFFIKSLFFNLEFPNKKSHEEMQNPVRLIRAIEIIDKIGYIPKIKKQNIYDVLFIGLKLSKKDLNERIYKRIIYRLKKGMLNEVHTLIKNGIKHERLQSLGLEYRFMSKHVLGEISREEMIEQLYRATVKFAKRQKTWFKRNKKIHWFHPINEKEKIFPLISNFLKK